MALDDNHVNDPTERQTIKAMQRLHDQGRDHIWACYTRNMVRPVALSLAKVDVVIGNPPWINYNQTADILRTELQNLSRDRCGIWAGGCYATHQDVAGLFFARSVDLYPQGRRRHRVRPAPQRVAGRVILQVAQRTMALWKLRPERSGGLHPQAVLGPGVAGTKHLLPGACLGGLRPQMSAGRRGQIPGRFGGAVARRGRRRGRATGVS